VDANGNTPIACAFFWPEITALLLEKGADPNNPNSIGLTPLVVALKSCNATPAGKPSKLTVVNRLLEKGADPKVSATQKFPKGEVVYHPVCLAAEFGDVAMMTSILDKNAAIKIGSSGFGLLEISGSDQQAPISTKNKTPIYWVIDKNNLDLVKKISDKMDWSFNPDFSFKAFEGDLVMQTGWGPLKIKGKTELSPAMYADIVGNKEAKKYLLK